MRKFVMLSPNFWIGQTGRDLRRAGPEAQLVALYLMSNPLANFTGLYRLPMNYIANDLGLSIETTREALAAIEETGFAKYDADSEYVWIVEGARHQVGELAEKDNKVKYVNKEYASHPGNCPYLAAFFEKYASSLHLKAPGTAAPAKKAAAPKVEAKPEPVAETPKAAEEDLPVIHEEPKAEAPRLEERNTVDELSAFLCERDRRGLNPVDSKHIAKRVLSLSDKYGEYAGLTLLKLATDACDYDMVALAEYEQDAIAAADI